MTIERRQGPPHLRREMPGWLKALDRWMPLAPSTSIHANRTADGRLYGYHIGGLGWEDGGASHRLHETRLGAAVATWEWWLTTEC